MRARSDHEKSEGSHLKEFFGTQRGFFKSKFENQIVDMKNEFKGKGLDYRSF